MTLPTIGDHDEGEVALAIGRKWGVGARAEIGDARRNAGLVLLLVPRDQSRARDGARADRGGAGPRGDRHRRGQRPDPARRHGSAAGAGGVRARAPGRGPRADRPDRARLRRHRLDARARAAAGRSSRAPELAVPLAAAAPALRPVRHAGESGRTPAPRILGRRTRGSEAAGSGAGAGSVGGGGGFGGFGGGGGFSGGGSGGRF